MSPLIYVAIAILPVAGWLATVHRALDQFSRSRLHERLEERGRAGAAEWLYDRVDRTILAVALLLIVSRASVLAITLVAVVSQTEAKELTWPVVVWTLVPVALILWLSSSVVTSALARYAAEGIVAQALPLLRAVTIVLSPLVGAVAFIDEAARRLTGANLRNDDSAESELLRSIEDTQREGILDEDAAALLENVVEFGSTDVGEVMTPRTDIEGIELTDDLATIRGFAMEYGHSRVPVYRENLDNIVGILYVKDLLPYLGETPRDFKLQPLLRQPIVVPETKDVPDLLADFQQAEVHMAIVVDEYGGTAGLVTIEDVLEEIVGEIHDEHDPDGDETPQLDVIDDVVAEVDARYHIDDLNERLGLVLPEDDEYDTVGGFMMSLMGRVPGSGESVESHDARFTALESTPTHVQRIRVELLGAAPNGNQENGAS